MLCDRCCAPATYSWWHAESKAELGACGHHSKEWAPTLLEHGWLCVTPRIDLGPVTADPATH